VNFLTVHMIMEGTISKYVVKLEPTIYQKYIWHDKKGKPMLYVQLKKSQVALLFWRLLSGTLVSWGFTINSYDQSMAIKVINDKLCTIVWHVDGLKISHIEVVEGIIKILNEKFGRESPLTTTRGKVHTMTIYQDSKSTILLVEIGNTSSSKRTHHLNVRY